MHMSRSINCMEWRLPPSRCRMLAAPGSQMRFGATSRSTASAGAAQQEQQVVVPIPSSREEAVSEAVAALVGQIKGLGGKKKVKKGFAATSGSAAARTRFSIELPLPSDSPSDSAAFLTEVLARLPPAAAAEAVVVCASEDTAAAAVAAVGGVVKGGKGSRVLSLQAACRSSGLLEGPLVLLEPNTADVALVDQLLDEVWVGPWALVVNPSWFGGDVPPQYLALVDSWEAAYSLTITATQGLMRTEGAVLRQLSPGSSSSPWRVLLKDRRNDAFVQVGQMSRRPTSSDLELAFINAKAAQSPLTSLVKGVRDLFDKQQQQQQ